MQAEAKHIGGHHMNARELLATTISDEILNLLEDAEDDDKEFDILLTNIDELISGYRI